MNVKMIDHETFAAAVSRAGGVPKAADLLGVSTDSVKRWARADGNGVPSHREALVESRMARYLSAPQDAPAGLGSYTDAELLLEIARRLASHGSSHQSAMPGTDRAESPYDEGPPDRGTHYGISGPPGSRSPRSTSQDQ